MYVFTQNPSLVTMEATEEHEMPWTRDSHDYEPPLGPAPWKNIKCSYPLSHLSSLFVFLLRIVYSGHLLICWLEVFVVVTIVLCFSF